MENNAVNKLYRRFLFLVLGSAALAMMARCVIHLVSHNYNLSAEANGLYGLLEFSEGRPLYPPRNQRPYHVYLYPPAHALVTVGLARLLTLNNERVKILFFRTFSLAA